MSTDQLIDVLIGLRDNIFQSFEQHQSVDATREAYTRLMSEIMNHHVDELILQGSVINVDPKKIQRVDNLFIYNRDHLSGDLRKNVSSLSNRLQEIEGLKSRYADGGVWEKAREERMTALGDFSAKKVEDGWTLQLRRTQDSPEVKSSKMKAARQFLSTFNNKISYTPRTIKILDSSPIWGEGSRLLALLLEDKIEQQKKSPPAKGSA